MSLSCRLFDHAPIPSRLWNGGYYFTKCARCECDLIGRGGHWSEVPAGYRVVWREVQGPPVDWTPWTPEKLRKDPGITEILAAADPARPVPATAALVVDESDGPIVHGTPAPQADPADLHRRYA